MVHVPTITGISVDCYSLWHGTQSCCHISECFVYLTRSYADIIGFLALHSGKPSKKYSVYSPALSPPKIRFLLSKIGPMADKCKSGIKKGNKLTVKWHGSLPLPQATTVIILKTAFFITSSRAVQSYLSNTFDTPFIAVVICSLYFYYFFAVEWIINRRKLHSSWATEDSCRQLIAYQ